MSCIADVSQRLQNALDSNYNVIDMSTVLEVITVLEGTTITKEQLETTRLAKYINQLRRKTSNDQLARRSKNLLKKWRDMVIPIQNAGQQQANTNSHPSSAISPTMIPPNMTNRLITHNTTLSNGTPTTPNLSTWTTHSQGARGAVISKENMIRRPMVTTPQSSIQHKSSSMPMTGTTSQKFPLPILNTNNGSNSSVSVSQTPPITTSTLNSNKVTTSTNRTTSVQPISFTNLISQTEVNQHIDGPNNKINPTTNSSNQSPKMPKIPRRNNLPQSSATTIENHRSKSPLFLMGNRMSNFRLPPHADVDDANSRPSFLNTENQSKVDYPNNNARKFNGFGNMFLSNTTKMASTPPVTFSSDVHDSHSDSSSMIMAPVSSMSLPMTSTTATPIETTDSLKHKKRKRQERKKDSRVKDVISLGGTTFDHSMSNSSSLGMFNSTTNTTNTTHLGNVAPSVHKLSELTFTGKFSKSDDAIINIDTTSGSSSPRPMKRQRTDSPTLMQDSPCDSPMLSVDNSNESEVIDSLTKPLNDLATSVVMPMTAVPLESADSTRIGIESNIPIPKKRGRKKGSTGVDRNMSLAGPSGSTGAPYHGTVSLLKTKMDLMRSVKKVKTTKELLAELQNRKPISTLSGNGDGSTNSSPMLELPGQSLVSPSSLCSDNSLTNSTDMRSTTATPVSMQTAPTPEPHADSLLNNDQPKKQPIDSKLEKHKTIDDEISELRKQLPPIDYDAVNNWNDHDDELICTCKLVEIDPPVANAVLNTFDGNGDDGEKVLQIEVKLTKIDEQLPKVPPDLSDSMRMAKTLKPPVQPTQRKPPMKSIFDLDFDDEDDPIHRYKVNNDEVKVEMDDNVDEKLPTESVDTNSIPPKFNQIRDDSKPTNNVNDVTVPCLPPPCLPPIPLDEPTISQRYEVHEDPHCPAKLYFITEKNCVTRYHVDTLHNYFIPNVNGNWSVIPTDGLKKSESKLSANDDQFNELEFVPKCNHMRMDKIPKNLRDSDEIWYRQRKSRKKEENDELVDTKSVILPDSGFVDQDETEVVSSRLSNSSQTMNVPADHVTKTESDGRVEQNCDLKTNCMDVGQVEEDVTRVNELQAMDGQSEGYVESKDSRRRKGNKRKSVKYKIRKSSSDFSRDNDGTGSQCDGFGDGKDAKAPEAPTRIILKFSRQVTTDAEEMDDDDDEDETDDDDDEVDDEDETFDEECEDEDENVYEDENEQFHDKDDLVEYNDRSNCHSNDNIKEICNVENNNDNNEKIDRNVDLSTDVMDVDHFKLRRFSVDDPKSPQLNNFDDDQQSPSSSSQLASTIPINHHSHIDHHTQPNLVELNHTDSIPFDDIATTTTPHLIDYDDDKTAEQLPLDNNELLASFNNISTENEIGVRTADGLEFKEWHEVVRVRSYNDELLTILPYVVID